MPEKIAIQRAWGHFEILGSGEGYVTKRLVIMPGHETSLQKHKFREEHWTVVAGQPILEIQMGENDPVWKLETLPGKSFIVRENCLHRISNRTTNPVVIIETWIGSELAESDIIRVEDRYGRDTCSL